MTGNPPTLTDADNKDLPPPSLPLPLLALAIWRIGLEYGVAVNDVVRCVQYLRTNICQDPKETRVEKVAPSWHQNIKERGPKMNDRNGRHIHTHTHTLTKQNYGLRQVSLVFGCTSGKEKSCCHWKVNTNDWFIYYFNISYTHPISIKE